MVELALVFPLFVMVLFGILIFGLGVFYQQQVTNAAREAARFAAIHSATAQCPTVATLNPASAPITYTRCDRPEDGWPAMTTAARSLIFGLPKSAVRVAACWSGYRLLDASGNPTGPFDAPPPGVYPDLGTVQSKPATCSIAGANPKTAPSSIPCTSGLATMTVDQASDLSEGGGRIVANDVTAYACYVWSPPLAGFLLIPSDVTLRAVVTEPIQRQQ